jgi:transposase-like protein
VVHFCRNVFSPVPATKVREVAHMLKAIHAQESRVVAAQKTGEVASKLKAIRLAKAAELVETRINETFSFHTFPDQQKRSMNMDLLTQMRNQTASASATNENLPDFRLAQSAVWIEELGDTAPSETPCGKTSNRHVTYAPVGNHSGSKSKI